MPYFVVTASAKKLEFLRRMFSTSCKLIMCSLYLPTSSVFILPVINFTSFTMKINSSKYIILIFFLLTALKKK